LKEGDSVDILKFIHLTGKATWSRGTVTQIKGSKLKIAFSNDLYEESTLIEKESYMLAPFKTKSNSFDWRLGLKIGDLVDCEDHYGSWYGSTITEIMER